MRSTDDVPSIYVLAQYLGLFAIVAICVHGTVFRGLTWDFINFYDAGHKMLIGQTADLYDPTALIGGQKPQGPQPFRGAPISAYLYAPLALLNNSAALVAFKIQSIVLLWVGLFLLYRHMRGFVEDTPRARQIYATTFVLFAAAFQPFWTVLYVGGQTTPLVFLLFVAALCFHSASRYALSALCLVVAITIKPGFAPALVFVALVSDRRFLAWVLAFGAVLGGISLLILGWDIHWQYLNIALSESGRAYRPQLTSAPFAWLDWFFMPPTSRSGLPRPAEPAALMLALRISVVVFFAWLYFGSRRLTLTPPARHHLYILLGILFSLLVLPVVWEHYLSFLFIPIAYVFAARRYFGAAALWTVGLTVAFSMFQHLGISIRVTSWIANIDTTPEVVAFGIFKAVPLLLMLVFLALRKDQLYASYAAPAWQALGAAGSRSR